MLAAWYDRQGSAADVLQVGELADPEPGTGEVRVRLTLHGVNPGDTKKRSGWLGSPMAFPRIIPHSDGAGVVDAVGAGVDRSRNGQRVWVYGAQSYRPFGTAAELVVVPDAQAVQLAANVSDELGACLGIPGITAHRCVFRDGPVTGKVVLVHGVLGGVASMAAQLARWNGASVIGTVRRTEDLPKVDSAVCESVVALDEPDPASAILAVAGGVHRVVEVSLSDNADLDAAVVIDGGVVAAYASGVDRPCIPFWPLLFANVSIEMLGSDDFPTVARRLAVQDLGSAAAAEVLTVAVAARHPLEDGALGHDDVDAGARGRILVTIA